jgi:hypothetical protein
MTRKESEESRCASGEHCAAYPTLGEPSKLSRGNPGPRCFACEERRAATKLKATLPKEKEVVKPTANGPRQNTRKEREEHAGVEHADVGGASIVLERRRQSVLTCQRGLHSAKASGDEHLVRRWSRALRDAEQRLAWAEADFERVRQAAG